MPWSGGIGIIIGLAAGLGAVWLLGLELPGRGFVLGALLIALVGFADDYSGGLSILARLAVQVVAAALVVSYTGGLTSLPLPEPFDIPLGCLAIPAALIWIIGVTNFYNFLAAIDGFGALQGSIAGLGIAFLDQSGFLMQIGFTIAGACIGFLPHNWQPSRVYMGDMGSTTVGFVLAALALQIVPDFSHKGVFAVAMCLWFFLSDGAFTVFRRLLSGEKVWQGHQSHLYQRLVRTDLRHDQVVLRVMGAAAVMTAATVLATRASNTDACWAVLVTAIGAFMIYHYWVMIRERISARFPQPLGDNVRQPETAH
jgi:UDP-GlcNAc:undecaprenyl-phosphate GlcNAc-1-phosphate transferase